MVHISSKSAILGLDILKFFMAFLVVAIHSEALKFHPIAFKMFIPLINCAVPTFFVVSSFLLFQRVRNANSFQDELKVLGHFTYRLILLYVFWFIVSSPIVLYNRHYLQMSAIEAVGHFMMDITLASTFHGSWFFSALVVGAWLIYFASKIFDCRTIWIIPFLVTCYAYNSNSLPLINQDAWMWYREHIITPQNSVPVALFWIALGYILSLDSINRYLSTIKRNCLIIMGGVSWIVYIFGIDVRAFMVVSMFALSLKWEGKYKPIYRCMRQSSILIFTLHFIFIVFFRHALPGIAWLQSGLGQYAVLILLCLISSAVILKLKDYKYFSWLKYSY